MFVEMEGEIREGAVQGIRVMGFLNRIMNIRGISMKVKKELRDSIVHPTLMHAAETWTWNKSDICKNPSCGIEVFARSPWYNLMEKLERNEVYERCGMAGYPKGMNYRVVEWMILL